MCYTLLGCLLYCIIEPFASFSKFLKYRIILFLYSL